MDDEPHMVSVRDEAFRDTEAAKYGIKAKKKWAGLPCELWPCLGLFLLFIIFFSASRVTVTSLSRQEARLISFTV